MSKVSPNNDTLPSFEPIERKPSTKRRRIPSKDTNPADLPSKRTKAKNITPPVPESTIWIGAKIIEQNNLEEEDKEDKSDRAAAFSVYYGSDDSRNLVQRLSMTGTDDLEYVYIKGVLHAIETCTDDFSKLSIHTGSKTIESALASTEEVPEYRELYSQIKEKISNRKGATVISYTQDEEVDKETTSYKAAHCLAKEFLEVVPDEDKEMTPVEDIVVECLDITSKNQIDEGVSVDDKKEEIKQEVVEEKTVVKETIIEEITEVSTATATATTTTTTTEEKRASWLGIRNIINIFKSPFNANRQ
ncbi:hypothetical protein K501DRAFT_34641 [Backusella circina FSU 941]|nr:hypothetical protein K501DRAFT_34641 [Backusella circina FSU 941]